jgi:hypothetical protein
LQLLHIAGACDSLRPLFGFGQNRQKEAGKNGDNRDDNQQLDQGETLPVCHGSRPATWLAFDVSRYLIHNGIPLNMNFPNISTTPAKNSYKKNEEL